MSDDNEYVNDEIGWVEARHEAEAKNGSELKPCPFCGGTSITIEKTNRNEVTLRCRHCCFGFKQKVIRQTTDWLEGEMAKNWNTRPIEDALRAQAERHRLMYEAVLHAQAVLTNGKDVYPNNPYIDEALSELADALSLYNTGKYPTEGE